MDSLKLLGIYLYRRITWKTRVSEKYQQLLRKKKLWSLIGSPYKEPNKI